MSQYFFDHLWIFDGDKYGADSVRFYLLNGFSPYNDGDFSIEGLVRSHNTFLVNGFGNLFSRLWKLCETSNVTLDRKKSDLIEPKDEPFQFNDYSQVILKFVDTLNAEINSKKPWGQIKSKQSQKCWIDLKNWANKFSDVGQFVSPILPISGRKIENFNNSKENVHLFRRITE